MDAFTKPLPTITVEQAPFWEAAHAGRLILQKCGVCGKFQHYPRIVCRHCQSRDLSWKESKGDGIVFTYSTVYRSPGPFVDDVPYITAVVELAEGARIYTRIVNCDPGRVAIGMKVRPKFVPQNDKVTFVYFEPAEAP